MWPALLMQFGMSKMKENEQRADARQQQIQQISSQLAGDLGAPMYGVNAAKQQQQAQAAIDEERRRRNQQMLQSVFSSMDDEDKTK
jgi:hypothetical protein